MYRPERTTILVNISLWVSRSITSFRAQQGAVWRQPFPAQPVSLDLQQGPLLETDHLPEAGFRLTKRPEEDLAPANPADD